MPESILIQCGSSPFAIDSGLVTFDDYSAFLVDIGRPCPPDWKITGVFNRRLVPRRHALESPAVGVSWMDATSYAQWAGKRLATWAELLETGKAYPAVFIDLFEWCSQSGFETGSDRPVFCPGPFLNRDPSPSPASTLAHIPRGVGGGRIGFRCVASV